MKSNEIPKWYIEGIRRAGITTEDCEKYNEELKETSKHPIDYINDSYR